MLEQLRAKRAQEGGFTLIELLIAIVVVGILAAVVIVGVNSLSNRGQASACTVTKDAANAAAIVHYANTSPNAYPTLFSQMTAANELVPSGGATVNAAGDVITGSGGWTLTISGGGATPPVLTAAGVPAGSC
jgi:prepilin-type N-terminal cleavage/methylation domain-containing protein